MRLFNARQGASALAYIIIAHIYLTHPLALSAQITSTWQAGGLTSWNDPANWSAGVPIAAGDHAIFGPGFPATDALVFVTDPITTVGTLTYNNPFQLGLASTTITFDGNGSSALIDVQDGQLLFGSGDLVLATDLDLSIATGFSALIGEEIAPAASLSGAGGLNIFGGGTAHLNGANTYTGVTHITNAAVRVRDNNSLGAGTGVDLDGTFINAGGTLEITSNSVSLPNEKITLDGGTLTGGPIDGQDWTLSGPIQLNSGLVTGRNWTTNGPLDVVNGSLSGGQWKVQGPVTISGELTAAGGLGRFDASISGAGGLRLNTTGVGLFVSKANSYTGITTVQDGRLLAFDDLALGAGTGVDADGTVVTPNGSLFIGSGRTIANEKISLLGGLLEGSNFQLGGPIASDGGTIKATSWTANGNVELTGNLTLDGGAGGVIIGAISGPGSLITKGGETALTGINTYTGQTVVEDGATLVVRSDSALGAGSGTNTDATIINPGGHLNPVGVTLATEKIILNGGTLGRSVGVGSTSTPTHLNGPIELTADSKIHGQDGGTSPTHINGTISGTGNLSIIDVRLNGANTYTGETTIINSEFSFPPGTGSGSVIANHSNSFGSVPNKLTLEGGSLLVAAPITVSELVVDGGGLNLSNSLTVNQTNLTVRSGDISFSDTGGLLGVTQITKATDSLFSFGFNANQPGQAINVERGVFWMRLPNQTFNSPITVAERHAVFGTFEGTIASDIHLLNSTGYAFGGVLQSSSDFSDITGRVDLGDVGSILSGGRAWLTLSGDVTGGAMTLSRGRLALRSTTASYTGRTTIALDGKRAELNLRGQGLLTTTSEIVLNRGGILLTHHERIGDNIPIIMAGGLLQVTKEFQDVTTETLGHVTMSGGDSIFRVSSGAETQPTSLVLGSFDRQPGAVVTFGEQGFGELGGAGPGDPTLILNPTPSLSNGTIGGWAIVEADAAGTDFATYDLVSGRGIRALDPAGRPDQVEGAAATDNVRVVSEPTSLTADTTINSLVWNTTTSTALDLGGHTLNVTSGGLLRVGGTMDITNGSLTAGGAGGVGGSQPDAELIFIAASSSTTNITADIVDNQAGAVSLVKSSIGTLALHGNNTYTGSTTVNKGELRFVTPGSIPANTDLTLNGGDVRFDFEPGSPIPLGTVRLDHLGILSTHVFVPTLSIDATEYLIGSGLIDIPISGHGTLTKNTFGRLDFGADNPNYSGDVIINEGLVSLEMTLGTSHITLNGGRLEIFAPSASNNFTLAGGELASNRGPGNSLSSPLLIQGGVQVTADSSLILYSQPNARDDTRLFISNAFDTNMTVTGPVTIGSGVTLSRIGAGMLNITGDLGVGQGSGLELVDGTTQIQGVILANDPVSSLDLSGPGQVDFQASLHVVSGSQLSISRDGLPFEFSVSGVGKTVSGNGTLASDLMLGPDATMMPGASAGTFTVDGDYTQLADAILRIELGGTAGLHDRLIVTGQLNPGGILQLLLIDDFVPVGGELFDILDFGSITPGSLFHQIAYPQLSPGLTWDASRLHVTGEIRVAPEPSTSLIMLAASGWMLRPARHRE